MFDIAGDDVVIASCEQLLLTTNGEPRPTLQDSPTLLMWVLVQGNDPIWINIDDSHHDFFAPDEAGAYAGQQFPGLYFILIVKIHLQSPEFAVSGRANPPRHFRTRWVVFRVSLLVLQACQLVTLPLQARVSLIGEPCYASKDRGFVEVGLGDNIGFRTTA